MLSPKTPNIISPKSTIPLWVFTSLLLPKPPGLLGAYQLPHTVPIPSTNPYRMDRTNSPERRKYKKIMIKNNFKQK